MKAEYVVGAYRAEEMEEPLPRVPLMDSTEAIEAAAWEKMRRWRDAQRTSKRHILRRRVLSRAAV